VKTLLVGLLLAVGAMPVAAQDVGARLAGRVPPEVATLVQQLAADAAARGLPVDPLVQKAIEGAAKGIPADRVATAVRGVAAQLTAAAAALRQGGLTPPDTDAIAAGAFALNAGLSGAQIAQLVRPSAAAPGVVVALRVAGTLTAIGVPAAETVALVSGTIQAGESPAELLTLPARVQAALAHGATPAQAAAGLARAAAARASAPGQNKPKHGKP